jgi:hypothetical protein
MSISDRLTHGVYPQVACWEGDARIMFGKSKREALDLRELEGVISFYGSHHAIRAEGLLKRKDFTAVLIPGPREISPNCGVAVRFDWNRRDEVEVLLRENLVHYEDLHHYPEV